MGGPSAVGRMALARSLSPAVCVAGERQQATRVRKAESHSGAPELQAEKGKTVIK